MSPLEEKATELSRDEIVALLVSEQKLTTRVEELERQLEWFKRQLFGSKSERRLAAASVDGRQLFLGEQLAQASGSLAPTETVRSYVRRRGQDAEDGATEEAAVRFDPSVPVQEIRLPNPEIENLPPDRYDIVGEKVTLRLAQEPGSYVVLRYVRPVVKLKETGTFSCAPAPVGVLEKSLADVSLLAGILIDKFLFHLPLYRQHQRMLASGIHLDRSTLTQWVHRVAALLEPIYQAQWESVLASSVLVMDETPIKAGRLKRAGHAPGKMKTGFFWPVYGDQDEIVFPFSASRAHAVVRELLGTYAGVLLTDGYEAYDRYAAQVAQVVHAQCWSHVRRYFIDSESVEPELAQKALGMIGELYAHEAMIREQDLEDGAKLEFRAMHCTPVMDTFFHWAREVSEKHILLPSSPFTKAVSYALEREKALRVFLGDPQVPVDTNALEREIRPIAVGRKNWMFCWTEVGAKYVGIIQSLLGTCRLQGVDPYAYLVDVLQRIETHPAREVHLLTPRLWKQHFAENPLPSHINRRRA
jgi:transposase